MASWKEERDRLVAQTLAFVQQVASAHPGAAQKLGFVKPAAPADVAAEPDAVAPEIAPAVVAQADDPIIDVAEPAPIIVTIASEPEDQLAPVQSITASLGPRPSRYATPSERDDIGIRVAAFRARQSALHHERDAYYQKMQARIRATLGNDSSSDRL